MTTSKKLPATVMKTTFLLAGEICQLIETARGNAAIAVNRELLFLYWHIGKKIIGTVLNKKRVPYGEQIVVTLSQNSDIIRNDIINC